MSLQKDKSFHWENAFEQETWTLDIILVWIRKIDALRLTWQERIADYEAILYTGIIDAL